MSETTVRPARRPAKPGGKRTANRFAKLAGGGATPESHLSPAVDDVPDATDGLIAGMSAVAVDEAHHVVEIAVAEIAPHPFNDKARSQPQPGDPKWDELLMNRDAASDRERGLEMLTESVPTEYDCRCS